MAHLLLPLRFLQLLLLLWSTGGICWVVVAGAAAAASDDDYDDGCRFFAPSSDATAAAWADDDRVTHLPGYDRPLPSPWFSGYVSYPFQDRTIHTHYVLVLAEDIGDEQDDEEDYDKKPLIYWSNGGPGASSLFGLFTELGPLMLNDDSLRTDDYRKTGIPTPLYNSFGWTRVGHILTFDQPAPVGFSYCNNETAGYYNTDENENVSCAGMGWNDELTAQAAAAALDAFFEKFPCMKEKDLFLTGESYGGIYIPTLARELLKRQQEEQEQREQQQRELSSSDQTKGSSTLKGFAVGDGCLGTETSICGVLNGDDADDNVDLWNVLFLAGHGQIPLRTFREVMRACSSDIRDEDDETSLLSSFYLRESVIRNWNAKKTSDACRAALKLVDEQAGGYFAYSLYDDCTYRNGLLQGGLNDYPCGSGPVMASYLQMSEVQKALHVTSEWFEVDNAEGFDYTPTEKDLTGFYRHVATDTNLRVLVYNGDTDPGINSFAAENWTSHLGLTESESWRPWTIDRCRRMGGYVTRYEGDFDFVTIRGAGHMVPTYKAEASITFIKAWIENGGDLPPYDKDCKAPPPGGVMLQKPAAASS